MYRVYDGTLQIPQSRGPTDFKSIGATTCKLHQKWHSANHCVCVALRFGVTSLVQEPSLIIILCECCTVVDQPPAQRSVDLVAEV